MSSSPRGQINNRWGQGILGTEILEVVKLLEVSLGCDHEAWNGVEEKGKVLEEGQFKEWRGPRYMKD